eukprot:scaffold80252_cov41-Phaeocystis_antarctica.AAC.2
MRTIRDHAYDCEPSPRILLLLRPPPRILLLPRPSGRGTSAPKEWRDMEGNPNPNPDPNPDPDPNPNQAPRLRRSGEIWEIPSASPWSRASKCPPVQGEAQTCELQT